MWFWEYVVSKCSGKSKTKHETDEGGKDVISEFTMTHVHPHIANLNIISSLSAEQKHDALAEVTQENPPH